VTDLLSPGFEPSHLVFAIMAVAFLFVFSATWAAGRVIRGRERIRQRTFQGDPPRQGVADDRRSLQHQRLAGTKKLLGMVAANFVPGDKNSVSAVRKNLNQAGFFQPGAVSWYYVLRVVLAVGLPGAVFLIVRFGGFDLSGARLTAALVVTAIAGLVLPSLYVSWRGRKMQRQSREGFPDFMDLLVVCAEAGIGIEAGVARVSRELAQNYPYLGVNLHMVSLELRAGRPLTEAFQNLAARLGIEEAHNLGSLLQQSEELGTSLSGALRVFSDEMRDKRMSRAEEKAHALPAKMAVPLTMFVFPTILIVILLPVFVRVSGL
jgi:tight adherence protein C